MHKFPITVKHRVKPLFRLRVKRESRTTCPGEEGASVGSPQAVSMLWGRTHLGDYSETQAKFVSAVDLGDAVQLSGALSEAAIPTSLQAFLSVLPGARRFRRKKDEAGEAISPSCSLEIPRFVLFSLN